MNLHEYINAMNLKNKCFSMDINQSYLNSMSAQEQINQLFWLMCNFFEIAKDNFKPLLDEFMKQFFYNSFVECLYIKETETIKLSFEHPKLDTTTHYYQNESLVIDHPIKE